MRVHSASDGTRLPGAPHHSLTDFSPGRAAGRGWSRVALSGHAGIDRRCPLPLPLQCYGRPYTSWRNRAFVRSGSHTGSARSAGIEIHDGMDSSGSSSATAASGSPTSA